MKTLRVRIERLDDDNQISQLPAWSTVCVCVCVCVIIPFILDVRLVDVRAGVTQEQGHADFLHLPSAVFALNIIARRIQPSLSLVDREAQFCVPTD